VNPFQRAREEANALRSRLLGERADEAVHATQILAPIEDALKLGIESVERDSLELGTGDACLHRQEKYIYVRKDVSPQEHAELVAHELGHWVLDAGKTPLTVASLAELARLEGSPGIVKVEAYGARERQELQANVFAREFLLPRHVARGLFVGDVGARKTAADLGIPLKVVRQQMLDAVLLPMAADPPPKVLSPPSKDQKKAARASERFANVVAGPGTGKTSTLIHRVKFLIEELNVDPSHILVLTFTNKAAFELVERLRATGIEHAVDIWAGTFHAFGLEFLRKYHDAFGLKSNIVVADKLNEVTMLSRDLPNLSLKHYLRVEDPYEWLGNAVQGITRLKEELVTPKQYRERLGALDSSDKELVAQRQDLATLYDAHERLIREACLVDFVDLVARPATFIRADRARYSELADKFQYILVDEYQDVTAAMVQLVKQLAHKAKSLWVVGDVRQAIHHWRGASVKSLIVFEETFKEQADSSKSLIRKYPLELNRRSSQEIVDLVTRCGESHVLQSRLPLDKTTASAGKSGVVPLLVSCTSGAAIPEAVGLAINHLRSKGVAFSQQTVLCRRAGDVERMARELQESGVPVLYIGELAQRVEVKQFLCLMQLLTERQPRALIGLKHFSDLQLPMVDIQQMLDWAKADVSWQRGRWLGSPVNGLSEAAQAAIGALSDLLKGHSRYSMPWDFLCDMLLERRFGLPSLEDQSINAHVTRLALWQFFHSVHAGDGDGKTPSLPRYLLRLQLRQRIGETYANRELPPEVAALDAVRVQTVHGSKGLEYEVVHVGYVDKDSYGEAKLTWNPEEDVTEIVPPEVLGSNTVEYEFEQAVERNNLFYVAVSRAKQRLFLYEDGNWAERNRPPQLQAQPRPFAIKSFAGAPVPSGAVAQPASAIPLNGPLSYEQFETYARCPLQHWYRFGIGLGREQEPEAPVRARFAVMAALKDIASRIAAQPRVALEAAWVDNRLPTKVEDPTLWRDAVMVFKRGLALLGDNGGTFEEPQTVIGGVPIRFPWVMADRQGTTTTFHLTRFSPRGVKGAVTLLRPMLSGLVGSGYRTVEISSLLSNAVDLAIPSKNVASTNAMAAATRFVAGDRSPRKGRHCKFCAYLTICPSKPV
jgi:superfamily I DNA/RNA helicase